MKKLSIVIISCLLTACSGMPPAWWNPSGTYSQKQTASGRTAAQQVPSGSERVTAEDETPAEQDIEPALDNYEEMALSPVDEQAQAQRLAQESVQNVADSSEQIRVPVEKESASPKVKENLPKDGSLPPPSVLE